MGRKHHFKFKNKIKTKPPGTLSAINIFLKGIFKYVQEQKVNIPSSFT